ncbi:MAG: GerMN domain-containing protein [Bacillota bacterium]
MLYAAQVARPVTTALLAALLWGLIFAGGCRSGGAPADEPGENAVNGDPVEVVLFFADAAAVDTGITENGLYVAPLSRELPGGEGLVLRTLKQLSRGPLPGEGAFYGTLPVTAQILSFELTDGVAVIDYSPELLSDSPGGSLTGIVFMQSLVFTATQFPEVEKVLVLVEGDPWSDGHFLWDEPIGRDDLSGAE